METLSETFTSFNPLKYGGLLMIKKSIWIKVFISAAFCITLLTGLFELKTLAANLAEKNTNRYVTIAHRGAAGYAPENTMAAFKKAVEMRADYFELDVQMSKDGELVVIHDTTVNRTTNIHSKEPVKVGNLTAAELKQLDTGSYFGSEFSGERIPAFKEVLDEFAGKIGMVIEIKAPELYPGIEEKIAAALIERNMDKPKDQKIVIQSFDFNSVKKIRKLLPEVTTAVLTKRKGDLTDSSLNELKSYADYVNTSRRLVTKNSVKKIHSYDMKIMPWTVRTKAQVNPLIKSGVDGIITDYPDYVPRQEPE
jgi:glycerophosphoryl diester phosphodiesterase